MTENRDDERSTGADRDPRPVAAGVSETSGDIARVWDQQHLWSLTANRLRRRVDRGRKFGLWLAIATAVLAVAAVQLGEVASWAGRTLTAVAAITAGLGALVVRRSGTEAISSWTRARSASEGIKSEVYQRLAGATKYTTGDPDATLTDEAHQINVNAADLQRLALGIDARGTVVPAVTDIESYIELRVDEQVHDYYRPRAHTYERRVRLLRLTGDVLGVIAVVLSAIATAVDVSEFAAWVPVVTTVGAAVLAHIAAARYDHQIIEFLRTASQLEYLRDTRRSKVLTDARFVDACEAVISVETQGWMTRWNTADET